MLEFFEGIPEGFLEGFLLERLQTFKEYGLTYRGTIIVIQGSGFKV